MTSRFYILRIWVRDEYHEIIVDQTELLRFTEEFNCEIGLSTPIIVNGFFNSFSQSAQQLQFKRGEINRFQSFEVPK